LSTCAGSTTAQDLYDWFKNFNPDMAATTGDIARRKAMLAPL
jgi:hypothetical protein